MNTRSWMFLMALPCIGLLAPIAPAGPAIGPSATRLGRRTRASRLQWATPVAPGRATTTAPRTTDAPSYAVRYAQTAPGHLVSTDPQASNEAAYVLLDGPAAALGDGTSGSDIAARARARQLAALDRLHMLVVPRCSPPPSYPRPLAASRSLLLTTGDTADARIVHPLLTPQVMAQVKIVHPLLTPQIMAHVKTIPVPARTTPAGGQPPRPASTPGPR